MNTPFEDLEFLADYLPDEGETVVVTRRGGELICQPVRQESFREGVTDAELYGRLILANERLNTRGTLPIWIGLLLTFATCLTFHRLTGMGWEAWYVDASIAFFAAMAVTGWIVIRRRLLFRRDIRPMLENQFRLRGLNRFTVIGSVRQHPELRTLLDEMTTWAE